MKTICKDKTNPIKWNNLVDLKEKWTKKKVE